MLQYSGDDQFDHTMVKNGLRGVIFMFLYPAGHLLQALQKEEGQIHLGDSYHVLEESKVIFIHIAIPAFTSHITL